MELVGTSPIQGLIFSAIPGGNRIHTMKLKEITSRVRQFRKNRRQFGLIAATQYLAQRSSSEILKLKIRGIRTRVFCRPEGSDFMVLRQAIGEKECDFPFVKPPGLIIDAGANVGYTTLFYANRWPGVRILAVEPEVHNCRLLRMNCSDYSNVTIIEGAVWQRTNPAANYQPECAELGISTWQVSGFNIHWQPD